MTAADILSDLTAAGVRVEVRAGTLHAGPRSALTDRHRALIAEHKAELLALLTEPRRLWLVTLPGGERLSVSTCPPATLAEMQSRYPNAQITPEVEHPIQPSPAPSDADLVRVRGWLARIGEADRELVADVLDRCRADARAFGFFLSRALEAVERRVQG